jgi:hypothetical protein
MFTLLSAPLGIAAIAMIESGPKRISATFNLAVYLVGLFGTFAFSWPLMRRDAAMLTAFISEALSRAEGMNEDQLRD